MTTGYEEFTGKTVEEALRNAREAFGVSSLDELDFEILTSGSRGVLGMGAEPARIVAAPRSALGGEAPRRAAAEAVPLPPPPPAPERRGFGEGRRDFGPRREGRRDDRGGRGFDRGPRDQRGARDGGPRDERAPQDGAPREERGEAVGVESRPGRAERRPFRGGDRRPDRRERPAPATATMSEGEEAQVIAARAAAPEHDEGELEAVSAEALAAGRAILAALMAHLGYDVSVDAAAGETSRLNVVGANDTERQALGALIGRKGERLSALQHLLNLMLSKQMGEWTRILVDVEGYRGRRERQLRELAQRAATRVEETGRMLQLEPMTALERRWIHLALRGHGRVVTQSIGEEPERRVVVLPRAEG
jgi:spoIIIJ-associated protein